MRILLSLALCLFTAPALACGGSDNACEAPLGTYFAAMKEDDRRTQTASARRLSSSIAAGDGAGVSTRCGNG